MGCPTTFLSAFAKLRRDRLFNYHREMGIDRAGWPFILGALVVAVAVGFWFGRAWSVPFLILGAFFLFFFRDPDRNPPRGTTWSCPRPTRA